jgi:hypothetical protein
MDPVVLPTGVKHRKDGWIRQKEKKLRGGREGTEGKRGAVRQDTPLGVSQLGKGG